MKKTKKGFTLVELLVVIAILAILATVSVVGYTSFIQKAKDSNASTELHQVITYVEAQLLTSDSFDVITKENGADVKYTVSIKRNESTKAAESLEVKRYTKTENAWNTSGTDSTIDIALHAIADFSELEGKFTVSGLEITFKSTDDGEATEKFSFR